MYFLVLSALIPLALGASCPFGCIPAPDIVAGPGGILAPDSPLAGAGDILPTLLNGAPSGGSPMAGSPMGGSPGMESPPMMESPMAGSPMGDSPMGGSPMGDSAGPMGDNPLVDLNLAADTMSINWERLIPGFDGGIVRVEESAVIDPNRENILMSSTDLNLRDTPLFRAETLYDFKNGLLGVRPLGSTLCMLAPIEDAFDEIAKDIKLRDGLVLEGVGFRRPLIVDLENPLTTSGSPGIDSFCVGCEIVQLADALNNALSPQQNIRFNPIPTLFGPLNLYIPLGRFGDMSGLAIPEILKNLHAPFCPGF